MELREMDVMVDVVSIEESKILCLAKGQYDHGIHGGTFTPGYVRKETGYGYDIINDALEFLVGKKYLEVSKTTTFRQGTPVEIELFRITEKGLQTIERMKSGAVRVGVHEVDRTRSESADPTVRTRPQDGHDPHSRTVQSARNIEATLAKALERTIELHQKVDRFVAGPPMIVVPDTKKSGHHPAETNASRKRTLPHQVLVAGAIKELTGTMKLVLSRDIEVLYLKRCKEVGLPPKNRQTLGLLLKSMSAMGLATLKLTGCRELGIHGHGSRLVVALTPKGDEFLKENAKPVARLAE
jgi:hypothetical protein